MRRLLFIAAALGSLAPVAARADGCAPWTNGPCVADAYGRTVCATGPGQACMLDGRGDAVCGVNCQIGADGYGYCQ